MSLKLLCAAALVAGAGGIGIQMLGGNIPDYPPVPPGVIILLVAAAVTAFVPSRWSPVAAVLVAVFLVVGLFAAGQAERLVEVEKGGDTLGLWVQMIAVVAAFGLAMLAMARPTGKDQ